ncbi:MAG: hypothetical protein IKU28_03295 [Erysipelotrichaceae bacterium]|nr:hypothetical protein [Erysipelotrichaceae bacterium]
MKWTVKSSVMRYQTSLIGYLLLIVLCAVTYFAGKASTGLLQGVLIVACLWAVYRILVCAVRIMKPVELIEVNRQCLIDHTSMLSLKEIPWYMVDDVKMMARGKQTVICLYGSDLKELVSKKAFYLRPLIHLNRLLGYGYHMIYPYYADVDLDLLYDVIQRKGR